ncbi:uncharacterized protein CC84DRAFT_1173228 [Paraphaeosphaeria sporulosa]|uniref:Uncharacterized protein n=1 Tax=Paraphaeosphaeria sporulosa TaxID=1460663 RepID=A0A177CV68_9PLEO|nr:uncharacterized protein CC84DRAFT_1173228 [Paraphaeosphaeria sporulosa]OAG10908.1 hypothetical protein CC84DRAFT_1173228 [Paraphaeosphaeria sporulosa]
MSAPTMDMPPVAGMVDLPTLAKMYAVLSTSHDDDDKNLAAWIKENYLPQDFDGVIEQGGTAIKGAEGFSKLYNAYKRVRILTNRTQDKWPFFDRRWKRMTSAQVTKMATSDDPAPPSNASAEVPMKSPPVRESTEEGPSMPMAQLQARTSSTALGQATTTQPPAAETIKPEVTQQPANMSERVERLPTPISPNMVAQTRSDHTEKSKTVNDMSATSTAVSILAVESAPEHSNLDDLPRPSGGKRKRDPKDFDERGLFARGHGNLRNRRGRCGGKGGRGCKNKTLATEQADSTDKVTEHTPPTFQDTSSRNDKDTEMAHAPVKKPKTAPPKPRVTRRQARLSGGSDDQNSASQAVPALAEPQTIGFPKLQAGSDTTVNDNEQNNTVSQAHKDAVFTDNEDTLIPDDDSATSNLTNTDLLAMGLSHYERPRTKSANTIAKADQDTAKLDSKAISLEKAVGQDTKLRELATVTYFARVNTGSASFEVSLDDAMNDNKKLNSDLLGYASWRQKMGEKGANVSFDMWLSIFNIGR